MVTCEDLSLSVYRLLRSKGPYVTHFLLLLPNRRHNTLLKGFKLRRSENHSRLFHSVAFPFYWNFFLPIEDKGDNDGMNPVLVLVVKV